MAQKAKFNQDKLSDKLKAVKAEDIMTRAVITTSEDAALNKVARVMAKKRVSGIPVIGKRGSITGIISEADLVVVMDMIESGDVPDGEPDVRSNPTVKFAMSTNVVKISRGTSLNEMISMVKYQNIQTLPVLSGKKLVGVVGRHDILKSFYDIVRGLR